MFKSVWIAGWRKPEGKALGLPEIPPNRPHCGSLHCSIRCWGWSGQAPYKSSMPARISCALPCAASKASRLILDSCR